MQMVSRAAPFDFFLVLPCKIEMPPLIKTHVIAKVGASIYEVSVGIVDYDRRAGRQKADAGQDYRRVVRSVLREGYRPRIHWASPSTD